MNKIIIQFKTLIILIVTCILIGGCAGDRKTINKNSIQKQRHKERNRDRTPDTPRINIPNHNF
jgi:hypothetical protein